MSNSKEGWIATNDIPNIAHPNAIITKGITISKRKPFKSLLKYINLFHTKTLNNA